MNSVSMDPKDPLLPAAKFGPKHLSMEPHCIKRRQANAIKNSLKIDRGPGRPPGPLTSTLLARRKDYADKKHVEVVRHQFSERSSQPDLLRALNTKAGRKCFPHLSQALNQDPGKETLLNSTVELVNNAGRAAKPDLVRLLGAKLKAPEVAKLLSMDKRVVQNIFARKRSDSAISPFGLAYPPNVTRVKSDPDEAEICVNFFRHRCATSSSASRESATLQLKVGYQVMKEQFYAEFPQLIQNACKLNPGLVSQARQASNPTRFQKSILAVDDRKFGSFEARLNFARKNYKKKLKEFAKRLHDVTRVKPAQKEWGEEAVKLAIDAEDIKDENDQVRPMSQPAFLQAIANAGIKFTNTFHPHDCPVHSKGKGEFDIMLAIAKRGEDELQAKYQEDQHVNGKRPMTLLESTQLRQFQQQRDDVSQSLRAYERHMKQFEVCRNYVRSVEDNLAIGECVVYRDFVSQYLFATELLGDKMNNLQYVLVWRDRNSNCLTSFKVANFCSDKDTMAHDAWYIADVFHFHIGTPASPDETNHFSGLLADFHTIYFVGDHGLSSKRTNYHESLMQTTYKKIIRPLFLCSYHAYSRADGAGGEPKRLALAAAKERKWWSTSEDYARGITRSEYQNSIGYSFPAINRSADIFPVKLHAERLFLNKMCDIMYVTDEVGVVFYREAPAALDTPVPYGVVDLMGRSNKDPMYLCVTCSGKQQQVCRHKVADCKFKGESAPGDGLNKTPNPRRIKGPQTGGQSVAKPGLFPCRVPGCFVTYYQKYLSSNSHMLVHSFPLDPLYTFFNPSVLYTELESERVLGKQKGPGLYPCVFPGCVHDFYTSIAKANLHMQKDHSPMPTLYKATRATKKADKEPDTEKEKEKRARNEADTEKKSPKKRKKAQSKKPQFDSESDSGSEPEWSGGESEEEFSQSAEESENEAEVEKKSENSNLSRSLAEPVAPNSCSSFSMSPRSTAHSSSCSSFASSAISSGSSSRLFSGPQSAFVSDLPLVTPKCSFFSVEVSQANFHTVVSTFSSTTPSTPPANSTTTTITTTPAPTEANPERRSAVTATKTPNIRTSTTTTNTTTTTTTTTTTPRTPATGTTRAAAAWIHPKDSLREMKSDDLVILVDESTGWFVGKIFKMHPTDSDRICVWEYGSDQWNKPKTGTSPSRAIKWMPKYFSPQKRQDMYSHLPLSQSDVNSGFKPVTDWQYKESALLWGDLICQRTHVLHEQIWKLIRDIIKNV